MKVFYNTSALERQACSSSSGAIPARVSVQAGARLRRFIPHTLPHSY